MLNWRNNQGVFHLIYSTRCDAWRLFLMAAALWWGSSWGISNAQEPPEACIDMGITPSSPRAERNVTLTANCSTADAGYYLTEYFWTFSDDPSASITTLNPSVTRIFASAGAYWRNYGFEIMAIASAPILSEKSSTSFRTNTRLSSRRAPAAWYWEMGLPARRERQPRFAKKPMRWDNMPI